MSEPGYPLATSPKINLSRVLETPRVSIYIPTRNRVRLLRRAVGSVLVQDYPNIEVIVVDDGSTDGTAEFLAEMQHSGQLCAFRNPFPMGAPASRNFAIQNASGEFITGLDDDDYFLPGRISAFIGKWRELEARGESFGFLFDSVQWLSSKGSSLLYQGAIVEPHELRFRNRVGNQVFTKTARLQDCGLFSLDMPAWQDWDLWLRLSSRYGRGLNVQQKTYVKDESHGGDMISRKPGFVMRDARDLLLRRHQPLTRLQEASVTLVLCLYPQVHPTAGDLFRLLPLLGSRRFFWERVWRFAKARLRGAR